MPVISNLGEMLLIFSKNEPQISFMQSNLFSKYFLRSTEMLFENVDMSEEMIQKEMLQSDKIRFSKTWSEVQIYITGSNTAKQINKTHLNMSQTKIIQPDTTRNRNPKNQTTFQITEELLSQPEPSVKMLFTNSIGYFQKLDLYACTHTHTLCKFCQIKCSSSEKNNSE